MCMPLFLCCLQNIYENYDEDILPTPEAVEELPSEVAGELQNINDQDNGDYQEINQLNQAKK